MCAAKRHQSEEPIGPDPAEDIDPLDKEDPLAEFADPCDPRQETEAGRSEILGELIETFREGDSRAAYQQPDQPEGKPLTEQSSRKERLQAYIRRAGKKGIEHSIRHPGDPEPPHGKMRPPPSHRRGD